MKTQFPRLIVTAVFAAFLCLPARSQVDENGRWHSNIFGPVYVSFTKFSKDEFRSALDTLTAIQSEETTDEWSGLYSARGSEVNRMMFDWGPKSGFVFFNVYTCTPELKTVQSGTVDFRSNRLTVRPLGAVSNEKPPAYLAVKWGERHYLVLEDRVREFYRFVAGYGWSDDEYVFFDFFEKVGDGTNPISGMPVFPAGYERFVKRPIDATVTRVIRRVVREEDGGGNGSSRTSFTYVALDKGSRHGLRIGMTMFGIEDQENLKIVKVGPRQSTGLIERDVDENGDEISFDDQLKKDVANPKIVRGSKFTTRSLNLIDDGYKWGM